MPTSLIGQHLIFVYRAVALYERTGPVWSCLYTSGSQISHKQKERKKEVFYLTTHSTYFIYGYMAREVTCCRYMGYSFKLAARVLLYAASHRQNNTYHGLCYTSRGALAGTRNSSMGPPHEGSIQRPITP